MLARKNRLSKPDAIRETIRRGSRVKSRLFVLHCFLPQPGNYLVSVVCEDLESVAAESSNVFDHQKSVAAYQKVCIITSKNIGNAVVRNMVRRRISEAIRAKFSLLPVNVTLVVRALPAVTGCKYQQIDSEIFKAFTELSA